MAAQPPRRVRVAAPNRLELFTPVYSGNTYGPAGEPTKQMKAKVCGPYNKRHEMKALMKMHSGRNASIISKFKPPLPKSEQHYEMQQISPESVSDTPCSPCALLCPRLPRLACFC